MTAIKFSKHELEALYAKADEWETYPPPPENLEGDADARGLFLVEKGSHGNFFDFGMATCKPSKIKTSITNDIICLILKGELTIEAEGKTFDLEPGDIVHYSKGTEVTMHFHTPFHEIFIHGA